VADFCSARSRTSQPPQWCIFAPPLTPSVGVKALAGVRRVAQQGLGIEFDDHTIGAIVTGWARGFAV
ncbi:MAG: hypothetical protein QF893_22065, partial [Alphaproteobacteria bacterium]|nr:hypothetical protein [Alphaproteobacteria bacterium]